MLTRGRPGSRSSSAARAIASGVNSSSSSSGGDAGSARSQNASPIAGARDRTHGRPSDYRRFIILAHGYAARRALPREAGLTS